MRPQRRIRRGLNGEAGPGTGGQHDPKDVHVVAPIRDSCHGKRCPGRRQYAARPPPVDPTGGGPLPIVAILRGRLPVRAPRGVR